MGVLTEAVWPELVKGLVLQAASAILTTNKIFFMVAIFVMINGDDTLKIQKHYNKLLILWAANLILFRLIQTNDPLFYYIVV